MNVLLLYHLLQKLMTILDAHLMHFSELGDEALLYKVGICEDVLTITKKLKLGECEIKSKQSENYGYLFSFACACVYPH